MKLELRREFTNEEMIDISRAVFLFYKKPKKTFDVWFRENQQILILTKESAGLFIGKDGHKIEALTEHINQMGFDVFIQIRNYVKMPNNKKKNI